MPEPPSATVTQPKAQSPSLIAKYHLQERLDDTVDEKVLKNGGSQAARVDPGTWEAHASDREAGLRERKAQMVLAARRCVTADSRMLEKMSN